MVPSSQKTSSAKVLDWIAWSMERVGVVIVSPEFVSIIYFDFNRGYHVLRKSNAERPGLDHADGLESSI